jgi:hypothetical protein
MTLKELSLDRLSSHCPYSKKGILEKIPRIDECLLRFDKNIIVIFGEKPKLFG